VAVAGENFRQLFSGAKIAVAPMPALPATDDKTPGSSPKMGEWALKPRDAIQAATIAPRFAELSAKQECSNTTLRGHHASWRSLYDVRVLGPKICEEKRRPWFATIFSTK